MSHVKRWCATASGWVAPQGVKYAVFGLGSRQYEHFCAVGKKVFKAMRTLGGEALVRRGDGDDDDCIDDDFEKWRNELHDVLSTKKLLKANRDQNRAALTSETVPQYEVEVLPPGTAQAAPFRAGGGSSAHDVFYARLAAVRELHGPDSDRSCVHVELDMGGCRTRYVTGDHVAVYPENSPEVVEVRAAGWCHRRGHAGVHRHQPPALDATCCCNLYCVHGATCRLYMRCHARLLPRSRLQYQRSAPSFPSRPPQEVAKILSLPLDAVFRLQRPAGQAAADLPEAFEGPLSLRTALGHFADVLSTPHKEALDALSAFAASPAEAQRLSNLAHDGKKVRRGGWHPGLRISHMHLRLCYCPAAPLHVLHKSMLLLVTVLLVHPRSARASVSLHTAHAAQVSTPQKPSCAVTQPTWLVVVSGVVNITPPPPTHPLD